MDALADHLPWGVAALMLVAALVVAWRLPRARGVVAAIVPPLRRRVLRLPKLHVVVAPPPEPASDGGVAEDSELPPAQPVDSRGNPVQMGRTPEEIEREPSGG